MTARAPRRKKASQRARPRSPSGSIQRSRRDSLLNAAAQKFGSRGYHGTSMRDIAGVVGMLAGSMYYHFRSKDALLQAVHAQGVRHVRDAVRTALASAGRDPWRRLEAACAAHLQTTLEGSVYSQVITSEFARTLPARLRRVLIRQRDAYEREFNALLRALPLPADVSRRYLRLALLGSLNWTRTWYRPGGDSPDVIARELLSLYRRRLETSRASD